MTAPASPKLSASQLAKLAEIGEERTAGVGDVLHGIGDQRYPFIAIVEGEVAIVDAEWLDGAIARDEHGFILTGAAANADSLLGMSLPGVFAAGDVRSGSTKRCATAVGEGQWPSSSPIATSLAPLPSPKRHEEGRLHSSRPDRDSQTAAVRRRL